MAKKEKRSPSAQRRAEKRYEWRKLPAGSTEQHLRRSIQTFENAIADSRRHNTRVDRWLTIPVSKLFLRYTRRKYRRRERKHAKASG